MSITWSWFLLFFSTLAFATTETTECFSWQEPVPFSYCVSTGNHKVLYEFHGRGESERSWSGNKTYAALIRKAWQQNPADRPTVISVSFGTMTLMVAKNSSRLSGLLEVFSKNILPRIEQNLDFVPEQRMALGESMGGFNAMQVALWNRDLFSKLALLCPALSTVSPFSTLSEMQDYIQRTQAKAWRVYSAMAHARLFMPRPIDWQQADIFFWLDDLDPSHFPQIYLAAGARDEFGFFEGASHLAMSAKDRGLELQWNPMWGDHCAVDVNSVVEFLQ